VAKRKTQPGAIPATVAGLEIRRMPLSQLQPGPYNPRRKLRPGEAAYERLRRSMQTFGYVDPLIWNKRTGHLVGGHQRLNVLIDEGTVNEVDVSVVDLSPAEEKVLNVALNGVHGEWDQPALAALLLDLRRDQSIDETLTGFEATEIDLLLQSAPIKLRAISVRPPPVMTWVLIGIPTVRYGEIAEQIDKIAEVPGILCELTANSSEVRSQS